MFTWSQIATINKRLTSIKVPDLLPRKPRSLSERAYWKATEFRAWLLYYSVPVLKGILHHTYLQHYSLLVSAMALLVGEKITPDELTEADNLIDLFCKELAFHYGDKAMTMNAHQLRHYVYFVRRFGPLWVYSCFGFTHVLVSKPWMAALQTWFMEQDTLQNRWHPHCLLWGTFQLLWKTWTPPTIPKKLSS